MTQGLEVTDELSASEAGKRWPALGVGVGREMERRGGGGPAGKGERDMMGGGRETHKTERDLIREHDMQVFCTPRGTKVAQVGQMSLHKG